MIVELVGAPGAGKTHLLPTLVVRCGVKPIKVGRLGQRTFYFAIFTMTHWRLTKTVRREFRRQLRAHPELASVRKWRRFVSMGAKTAKAHLLGRGIIDEGIFQALLKIFEDPATLEQLEQYLGMIGTPPDRVYIIDARDDVRYERMAKRQLFPRRYLGEDQWQHWHKSFVDNFATLKPILVARYNGEIIDNNGPPSA